MDVTIDGRREWSLLRRPCISLQNYYEYMQYVPSGFVC